MSAEELGKKLLAEVEEVGLVEVCFWSLIDEDIRSDITYRY